MTRPSTVPVDAASTGWVGRLNSNFQKLIDLPVPLYMAADQTALDANNPGLYANCLAILQTDKRIYRSNGTAWVLYDTKLAFVAPVDTGTISFADLKTAYNNLLTDMRAKGLMAAS